MYKRQTSSSSGVDKEVAKLLRELKNELKQDRDKLRKERDQRDSAERERQKQLIALMSQATTKDLPTAISQIVSEQLGENAAAVQAALATNAAASQRAAVLPRRKRFKRPFNPKSDKLCNKL